jgi:hypothetical protein
MLCSLSRLGTQTDIEKWIDFIQDVRNADLAMWSMTTESIDAPLVNDKSPVSGPIGPETGLFF